LNTKHLPPPLRGLEPDSWARTTIVERLPDIARKIPEENDFPGSIEQELKILWNEIPEQKIRPIKDQGSPDFGDWRGYTADHLDQNWLETPWFFAEIYFYRRVMEAVRFFERGEDPFLAQKEKGYQQSAPAIEQYADQLLDWLRSGLDPEEYLQEALYFTLWGNQADYSLWPADGDSSPEHEDRQAAQEHLLADDSPILMELLGGDQVLPRVDFLLDNAGFELITDLGLADLLLSSGRVDRVVLHAKAHPTFVSDVIPKDVNDAVRMLAEDSSKGVQQFGRRLRGHARDARMLVRADLFWNSPLAMWDLPEGVERTLAGADLLISKGDANYRRLTGDRSWEFTTPFSEVIDYLPVPLAAFRTLKAELAVGLTRDAVRRARRADPDWMTDGRWGVIQYAPAGKQ
jgi:uncharacterized protein with ATP-grasp and redox domains